jgi:diphthamide synthase (EF-2-diphthine--ammonia ligase)
MWSGGKDSALALDRARRAGIEVARLISFYDSTTRRVRFHSTRVEMLEAQAAAIGIGLRAIPTSWPEMEANLRQELSSLREEGFTGVVFGDIHIADVRAWYEERVTAAGLAVITCVDLAKLEEVWLGRVIDERFASEIGRTGADACGENGEYHSFAFAGPVFSKPLAWTAGERRLDSGFAQLDLTEGG